MLFEAAKQAVICYSSRRRGQSGNDGREGEGGGQGEEDERVDGREGGR